MTTKPAIEEVNHPSRYNAGAIECIDAIESALTPEEYRGFIKGTILRYVWREKHKGGNQDLAKAEWYTKRLLARDQPKASESAPAEPKISSAAVPKYPQTSLTEEEMADICRKTPGNYRDSYAAIANAAIARAIQDADVVPAKVLFDAGFVHRRYMAGDIANGEWLVPDMVPAAMLEKVANEVWDSARAYPETILLMAKSQLGGEVIAQIIASVKEGK